MDVNNPPITTLASGRRTSAPVEAAVAIGINPNIATPAVISTGRNLRRAPAAGYAVPVTRQKPLWHFGLGRSEDRVKCRSVTASDRDSPG